MPSIEDYALIGDCETAALVSREGSIDWLCFPRFDSPACFAALVGTPEHGRWLLAPCGEIQSVRRQYVGDTAVLETEFTTADGVVAVIDFMPVRSGLPDLVRIVLGRRGKVEMRMELTIRFDYGSVVPWVRRVPMNERLTSKPPKLHGRDGATTDGWRLDDAGLLFLDARVKAGMRTIETGAGVSTIAFALKRAEHTCVVRDRRVVRRIRQYCASAGISLNTVIRRWPV